MPSYGTSEYLRFPLGERYYRGAAPVPVYAWTAPGPDIKGGLAHILLRTVPGRFHQEQKALVSDRAFHPPRRGGGGLWRMREGGIESWVTPGSPGSFRGAGCAASQASGQKYVPREVTVAQWRQAGDHPAACLCECLNTPNGDVSPAYAFKQKILPY